MKIAADTCVYTNHNTIIESINRVEAEAADAKEKAEPTPLNTDAPKA
jgi:hypothetical protein